MRGRPRRTVPLALALLLGTACAAAEEGGATITPAELAQRIAAGDAPQVLDVRSREEHAAGHIPGARNIPHDELASRLSELADARDAELVVHCASGRRAALAEDVLREAGFRRVRDLEGHMRAWQAGGHPVE